MAVPCPLFLQNDEENLVLQQVKYAKKKRRGINMRKYQENGMLESVVCNGCGKKLVVERGILREGGFAVNYPWDYFSEKDGEPESGGQSEPQERRKDFFTGKRCGPHDPGT